MSLAIKVHGITTIHWSDIQHYPPSQHATGFCTRELTLETTEGPVSIVAFANHPAALQPQEPAKPALALVAAA